MIQKKQRKPTERHMIQSAKIQDFKKAYDGTIGDRGRMNEQIKNHLDILEENGINDIQNFSKIFSDHEYISKDQQNIMTEFVNYMKEQNSIKIFLLKSREMKKANENDRDIIMNRLAVEYPNNFIKFLKDHLNKNYKNKTDTEKLIQELQAKINQLEQQKLKNAIPNGFIINQDDQVNLYDDSNINQADQVNLYDDSIINQDDQNYIFGDALDNLFNNW